MPETQQADRHAAMGLSGEGSGEPECQQRLANLLANLPGIAYRCANDERWTMEFLSDGCIDVTGYSPHELIGNRTPSFYDLIRPDYRGLLRDRVGEALAERRSFEFEYPISTKSGEQKWVWERGFGVIGADGELVGLEGFITDITARKQTQEQLQRSEERLRNMVEHLPAGAVFRDEDTLILNQAAEQITGYSRTELANVDDWFRTLYGDLQQERRALYEASRTSGFPTRRLLPITRKDGKRRYVEFAAYAYDRGEVWLLHDVTELKAAENELRSYQDQLRSLASALSLAEDRERRRIAAELHDGPGQTLSMAHVKLVSIRDAQTTPESASTLEEARRMID